METKKLKPGTIYATCDGKPVVPVSPVERVWVWGYDEKRQTIPKKVESEGPVDPWGGCMNPQTGRRYGRRHRLNKPGLLCETFDVDRDGKQTGARVKTIVDPKDIKGLWDEFLVLHGKRIREAADAKEWRSKLRSVQLRWERAVKKGFGEFAVHTSLQEQYRGGIHPTAGEIGQINIQLRAGDRKQFKKLRPALEAVGIDSALLDEIQDMLK